MARDPRALTQPWRLVEVTSVTIQNRYLLRPSAELNDLVIGVVVRHQPRQETLEQDLHGALFEQEHDAAHQTPPLLPQASGKVPFVDEPLKQLVLRRPADGGEAVCLHQPVDLL